MPPNTFIAVAEESGLIHRLGDQLLRKPAAEAKNWPEEFTLAFNISPVQCAIHAWPARARHPRRTGLPARRLGLEITEGAIVGDGPVARQMIDELRAAGVRIALDDFGTGYATMEQAAVVPLRQDQDRPQLRGGSSAPRNGSEVIVRAIIGLAKGLGLATTAEGIETAEPARRLKGRRLSRRPGLSFSAKPSRPPTSRPCCASAWRPKAAAASCDCRRRAASCPSVCRCRRRCGRQPRACTRLA